MAERTGIEWTDATFNPWIGCAKVSPGCANCYAENEPPARKRKSIGLPLWGQGSGRQLASESGWKQPLAWERRAEREGVRLKVFCASLADVFESCDRQMSTHLGEPLWADRDGITPRLDPLGGSRSPYTLDNARARLWRLIEATPHLDWQLLTKRASNMSFGGGMVPLEWHAAWPANVWAGVSVEDQKRADERIPWLLTVPARVRFLSCEPLLGAVDLTPRLESDDWGYCLACGQTTRLCEGGSCPECGDVRTREGRSGIHWVIVGGESGPRARSCEVDWVRSLVRQCRSAAVPCFVKQLGYRASDPVNGIAGKGLDVPEEARELVSLRLRDGHGGDPAEWPPYLRVRQFPRLAEIDASKSANIQNLDGAGRRP